MAETTQTELPQRRAITCFYNGRREGMHDEIGGIYAWVATFFSEQMSEISICLDSRLDKPEQPDPNEEITAEARFVVDSFFPENPKLPQGLSLEPLPRETAYYTRFKGPVTEFIQFTYDWLKEMEERHKLMPGYRLRHINSGEEPTSPDWEFELLVVEDSR